MDNKFPKEFLWGAATSAYQVEGAATSHGKKLSQQDVINKDSYEKFGFATAEIASDEYHHYKEDVALMKEMGFKAYRFSIAWSRVFPDGIGPVNEEGIQYYRDLIDELKANDIEPIVTLYHYDLPMALVDKYDGWISREVVKDFEYYARYVINEFKDKVKYWTTINEQSIIVQFIEQKCYIPEKYKGNNQIRYQINHHMNLAHAIACKLVHELVPNGLVGAAIGYAPVYPLTSKPEDVMAAQNANDLHNQYYLDIYFKGHYTKSAMIYLELLWSFFQIGLFSIGGGYAAMPLIQNQVVDVHSWLTMTQFADIMTIAEMTPGPIAINSATFVGIQTAGIPGAIIATIGCVLPSCMIVMTLAYIYYRFRGLNMVQGILAMLRPAVVAMIASACLSLMILSFYGERTLPEDLATIQWIPVLIFAAGFFILRKWKVNPIYVMLGSGAAGVILFSLL